MQVLMSILLILIWGIFTAILHVYKLGLGSKIRSILTGISLYTAMVLAILIGEDSHSWFIALAFLFLIPGGIGISYFVNWFIGLAQREKINQPSSEWDKNKQSKVKTILLVFNLFTILLMVLMNTPISMLAKSWQPISVGPVALIVTTVVCILLSGFSLAFGYIILIRGRYPFVKYAATPLLSMLFAFVPAIYGTVIFLVTGNTVMGIFFDVIALVFVLLFTTKLMLKKNIKP